MHDSGYRFYFGQYLGFEKMMTEQAKEKRDELICGVCGQDHRGAMKNWCDRSYNEIKLDNAQERIKQIEDEKDALKSRIERLESRLKMAIYFQEKAKSFFSHYEDCDALTGEQEDGESCLCGLDAFAHDNYISIVFSKAALKQDDEVQNGN